MTTNINADDGVVSGVAGLKTSADNSGVLALQTNGTTGLTVNASQAIGVGSTPSYGTSGQVLTSGGSSAAPTWTTVGGGSSQWVTSGSNIYYSTGNVGIKTTTFSSISGTVATLSMGGTNASTSGGIAYQTNGTVKGYHYIDSDNMTHQSISGGHLFLAVNTEKARINTYGLGLGGAVPSSGIGITFPAAQDASSNANTLDDYEEGTWTPTMEGTGSNPTTTYAVSDGTYVKIGRTVFVNFAISTGSQSGGSGSLRIGGLPFTASSAYARINPIYETARTMPTGRTMLCTYIDNGTTKLNLIYYGGTSTGTDTLATSGTVNMYGMIFYTTS